MDLQLRLQHDLLAVETEHDVHGMVDIAVPDEPVDGSRPPLRLALVLDRSGSMAGEKLDVTKRCARYLTERLSSDDELALVTYDDEVEVRAPLAAVDEAALGQAIGAIASGGMTNLSGGWLKGVEELRRRDDGTRRVLLLTDGLANRGVTQPERLRGMAEKVAGQGITTTTLGFGDGFNEELLTAMADAGRGMAHYIASVEDAPAAFAEEFEGLVSLVAQNVSVEIRPSDEVKLLGILNEYPANAADGGVQVSVGDAYAGHRLRVVFRLHIPDMAALGPAKVAEVVVRYVSVGDEIAEHQVTYPVKVNLVSADEAAAAGEDAEVTEEVTVLMAAQATDEARRLADEGRFDQARERLNEVIDKLRDLAPDSDRAADLQAKADSLEWSAREMSDDAYSPAASKRMHYRSHEMKRRRPTRDDSSDGKRS